MKPRSDRNAGIGVFCTAFVYALHAGYVAWLGPLNERAASALWVWAIIAGTVLGLTLWAGITVIRGGRMLGAVILMLLFAMSFALAAVLALSMQHHTTFIFIQIAGCISALSTLMLLAIAQMERDRERSHGRRERDP